MNKYIDAEKLKAEIKKLYAEHSSKYGMDEAAIVLDKLEDFIDSIQQEQPELPGIEAPGIPGKDFIPVEWVEACQRYGKWKIVKQEQPIEGKQVIIITETDGDANIHWDCRSLGDVMALLKSAESFITDKQVEKMAGPGSGPDYATEEGRYSYLFKRRRKQPEVDIEKESVMFCFDNGINISPRQAKNIASHFWNKGYNAGKEGTK